MRVVIFRTHVVFELRILGPPRITSADGRSVETLIRQSKRTALLAYLAAASPRGAHRRDKLLALFWPESDGPHARSALSQALYVLRSTLGDPVVRSVGDDEVSLNGDVVWCDAVAFENALDSGRPAEALALYSGDLLDGFFVAGAAGFEQWLDHERERLRQRASEGAWALARAKAMDGDAIEAARWAKRASDLVPADEVVARRLMIFLYELGDRAAAMRAYEAFAWRLAHDYELEVSAETKALAAEIRAADARADASSAPNLPQRRFVARLTSHSRGARSARYIAAAVTLTLLAAGAWASLREPDLRREPLMRFSLEFADAPPLAAGTPGSTIALSPDGEQLVYVGVADQSTQLFLRKMDGLETAPVPHTRTARMPFFSPDGEWLGFVIDNTIRKVRVSGGPAVTVHSSTTRVFSASWGPDDIIVFATAAGLWQASANGGLPNPLTDIDTSTRDHPFRWPEVLPNGKAVVFTRVDATGYQLAAVTIENSKVIALGVEGTNPRFVAPGYLVFARMDGALLAAPFDEDALRITGNALPITEGVLVGGGGGAKLGLSRTGTLVYVPESSDRTLVLVDRKGRAQTIPTSPRAFGNVRFSPDGRHLAMTIKSANEQNDIWLLDLEQTTLRRITSDTGSVGPVWSAEGQNMVFASNPGGRAAGFTFHSMSVFGRQHINTLRHREIGQLPIATTPDGQELLFQRVHPENQRDIWILPLKGDATPKPYLHGPADERAAAISPDGRWVAYVSDQSGQHDVYVASFPKPITTLRISTSGGWEPRWAPRENELFYRTADGLVSVAIRTAPALSVGTRQILFDDTPYMSWFDVAAYDVHPDGLRFAMIRRGSNSSNIIVLVNWLDQIRSRRD